MGPTDPCVSSYTQCSTRYHEVLPWVRHIDSGTIPEGTERKKKKEKEETKEGFREIRRKKYSFWRIPGSHRRPPFRQKTPGDTHSKQAHLGRRCLLIQYRWAFCCCWPEELISNREPKKKKEPECQTQTSFFQECSWGWLQTARPQRFCALRGNEWERKRKKRKE